MSGGPNDPGTPILGLGPDNTLQEQLDNASAPLVRAQDVAIDDSASQITATTVEGALAEILDAEQAHEADTSAAHAASAVSVDSTSLVGTGTDVQAVFEELDNGIADHLADSSDAHDASAVSILDTENFYTGTDVEAALNELGETVSELGGLNATLSDEVQTVTLSGGAENDTFKFTYNAHESSAAVTIPAGGFANATAANMRVALITVSDFSGVEAADIVASGGPGSAVFTFGGKFSGLDMGGITITSATGAAAGSVAETLKGGITTKVGTDQLWDAAGDVVVGTGANAAGRVAITVPAANVLNVLGVVNGETTVSWKSVHDATAPEAVGTAAAGTSVYASHRDHAHAAVASSVTSSAVGNVVATDVQSAIQELDTQDTDHAAADLASAVHGFKGMVKFLVNGQNEVIAVNEVKILTNGGAGAEGDLFTLTVGAGVSANIVLPAGGFANLTADTVDTALEGGTLGWAEADCVVTGAAGGPFTLTFGGALAATNVGNMTVTGNTGALIANPFTVLDDGTGGSVVGVVATVYTVTGIAVGDSLAPVTQYATKAAIATQTLRAITDYTIGAGTLTVIANPVNNTNNEILAEWIDLT